MRGKLFKKIKFSVLCPCAIHRTEKMEIEFVPVEGAPFPLPCNGCDSSNGSNVCQECMAWVTLYFYHHPDSVPESPLVPRLDTKP